MRTDFQLLALVEDLSSDVETLSPADLVFSLCLKISH